MLALIIKRRKYDRRWCRCGVCSWHLIHDGGRGLEIEQRQSPHALPHAICNNPHHPPAPATARPLDHVTRGGVPDRTLLSIFCALRGICFFVIRAAVRDTVLRVALACIPLPFITNVRDADRVPSFRAFFFIVWAVTLSFNQKRCSKYHLVPPHLGAWTPSNGVSDVRGFVGRACP